MLNFVVFYVDLDAQCTVRFDNNSYAPQLIIQVSSNTNYNCSGWICNGVNVLMAITNENQGTNNVQVISEGGKIIKNCYVTTTSGKLLPCSTYTDVHKIRPVWTTSLPNVSLSARCNNNKLRVISRRCKKGVGYTVLRAWVDA